MNQVKSFKIPIYFKPNLQDNPRQGQQQHCYEDLPVNIEIRGKAHQFYSRVVNS